ncbi:AMP-binding protein [Aquicoccus sp. G2-2]|uniref:AMP-binding protein n=1 Tax=Aquicoccus sp. G2-2 TaxID=3092120 RepID=UPI002AE03520|nr:AMP-binding protein [Aquicoccus sp. G2-2]MEA1113085.1 AMP-binding protein [Aquicoccus sp. G2-2]
MIEIEGRTIDEVFVEAAASWPNRDFLVTPQGDGTPMQALSYTDVAEQVARVAATLRAAGYGAGQRVAVCLGTCPEHYILKLAVNRCGMSFVPVNPDYRASELAYVLGDSGAVLTIADEAHAGLMRAGLAEARTGAAFARFETLHEGLPDAPDKAPGGVAGAQGEASLLYTSGTTGHPKGCILSHEYELMIGAVYPSIGGPVSLGKNDRIFNPLPAFHINAGVLSFLGAMLVGAALIQPERFSARTWWRDTAETGATIFHYLGVVISVLMADKSTGPEVLGNLRAGLGAGVEPALHEAFEQRFGIPLIEVWGMTEMCRITSMWQEPRMIHTRAMGRARGDLQVQVWDDAGREVPRGTPGEMVMRHSEATPEKGFFSGYLNKVEATVEAWKGGWFHTGDTVCMDEAGIIYFVDRKKNIIRRAGENIAAAEVENIILSDERVISVACVAAPDAIREEEVLAVIVLAKGVEQNRETALNIRQQAAEKLAYFKVPGWILFASELPVTGTQKLMKHKLFKPGEDPRERAGIHDLRALKRRG